MSPFTIGKVQVYYDTVILGVFLLVAGVVSTSIITKRLAENARLSRETGNETRLVLLQILQRMDDQQQLVKDVKEVQIKQRELFLKAQELEEQLSKRAKKAE